MTYERVDCPLCHGEGCLESFAPGGYYRQHNQTFYPFEQIKECPECFGVGSVEVEMEAFELEDAA